MRHRGAYRKGHVRGGGHVGGQLAPVHALQLHRARFVAAAARNGHTQVALCARTTHPARVPQALQGGSSAALELRGAATRRLVVRKGPPRLGNARAPMRAARNSKRARHAPPNSSGREREKEKEQSYQYHDESLNMMMDGAMFVCLPPLSQTKLV